MKKQSGMWFNRLNWDKKPDGWHWYWKCYTGGPYATHRVMRQSFDQSYRKFKIENKEMIRQGYVSLHEKEVL
jgi:hypothetical protein